MHRSLSLLFLFVSFSVSATLWNITTTFDGYVESQVFGDLFVFSNFTHFVGIEISTGKHVWINPSNPRRDAGFTGYFYATDRNEILYSILQIDEKLDMKEYLVLVDAQTGVSKWHIPLSEEESKLGGSLTMANDRVYLFANHHEPSSLRIFVRDRTDGGLLSTFEISAEARRLCASAIQFGTDINFDTATNTIMASCNRVVFALDGTTGKALWEREVEHYMPNSMFPVLYFPKEGSSELCSVSIRDPNVTNYCLTLSHIARDSTFAINDAKYVAIYYGFNLNKFMSGYDLSSKKRTFRVHDVLEDRDQRLTYVSRGEGNIDMWDPVTKTLQRRNALNDQDQRDVKIPEMSSTSLLMGSTSNGKIAIIGSQVSRTVRGYIVATEVM